MLVVALTIKGDEVTIIFIFYQMFVFKIKMINIVPNPFLTLHIITG